MSGVSESSPPEVRKRGVPPIFLIVCFLALATAGSAFVVMPDEQSSTVVSSSLLMPSSGPDKSSSSAESVDSGGSETPVSSPPTNVSESATSAETLSPSELVEKAEAKRQSRLLVGNWRQDYFGERTLSVKADGTATMTIVPDSLWAVAFGNRVDLTMFWSVKDGHLDYGINGGTPADKVTLAAKTWGDKWVEKIIELNEKKLDLLSVDGVTHSIWERVPDSRTPAAGPGKVD